MGGLGGGARAAQRGCQVCHQEDPPDGAHHSLPPHPVHHVSPEPLERFHCVFLEPLERPGAASSAKGPQPFSAFLLLRRSMAAAERCRWPEERVVGPGRIFMCSSIGQCTSLPQCDNKDMMDAREGGVGVGAGRGSGSRVGVGMPISGCGCVWVCVCLGALGGSHYGAAGAAGICARRGARRGRGWGRSAGGGRGHGAATLAFASWR